MIPRSGMNGMPFSAACSPAWMAGQVESSTRTAPVATTRTSSTANRAKPILVTDRNGPANIISGHTVAHNPNPAISKPVRKRSRWGRVMSNS